MNKYSIAVISSIGVGFLVYCIYFDRKRRLDPNYKAKLQEKRLKKEEEKPAYPDLSSDEGVQHFYVTEMNLGEQCLMSGDVENGTEHMANAILVSPSKEQLLNFFRMQLPDEIFQLILNKLPICGQKILKSAKLKEDGDFKIEPKQVLISSLD